MIHRTPLALRFALLAALMPAACDAPQDDAPGQAQPLAEAMEEETASGDLTLEDARRERAREAMVAAAHPLAVEAGLESLRAGGDAVDAAVAVQAVLGLVEPQSSGLGGGAFMVRYDAQTGAMTVYDGRETAPAGVDEDLFLNQDGEPLGFVEAWTSGRSVGAPGVVAMLAAAHADHGALDWAAGFDEAGRLAREGFAVSPRLANLTERIQGFTPLSERPDTRAYFYGEDGEPHEVGDVLTNPAYAETAAAIAEDWRNFYTGEIAQGIVEAARLEPLPGAITLADIEAYEPLKREAVCTPYRAYRICSAPPPSSGAVAVGQLMSLLEPFDMAAHGPETARGWHLFIEASRLAYADRDAYVGDPAYADVPTQGLIDRDYVATRAALIDPARAMPTARPGTPPGAPDTVEDASDDAPGTSHFVVVDADGDVVSMTTTVESPFGSNRMTGGFLLNNQLTDFAFEARDEAGRLRPNAVAPGKRPRSSMSPVIVLDEAGDFVLATGSPGGNSIIAYTAKSLVAMLDWGLSPDEAAALPNVVARGDVVRLEDGFDEAIADALRDLGHTIEGGRGENSGLHIVRVTAEGGLDGAADPRRDGVAKAP